MSRSNYDKTPCIEVPETAGACVKGWDAVARRLNDEPGLRRDRCVVAVECYPGVDEPAVVAQLTARLATNLVVVMADGLLPPDKIDKLLRPYLGGTDPVFGRLTDLRLPELFDPVKCEQMRSRIAGQKLGVILVVGCGACYLTDPDVLVYADLSRREAQLRFRRGETGNLGALNRHASAAEKYKRAFFADWRIVDRWKEPLISRADFWLDSHNTAVPMLAEGAAVRRGLQHATNRPFRVVPYFEAAPWGGQWLKEICDLDPSPPNYGWCFDCVPEENSLLLGFGIHHFELPAMDLVLYQPRRLLGENIHRHWGAEFPIRFDMLDTMGGGNLSLQVHPMADYIRQEFGVPYTQDESYYLIDAAPHANVYLGMRDGASPAEMTAALYRAHSSDAGFAADDFVSRWSARKHDHFLIPAGTVHCSGRDSMVLEISATPYIFTFKLWDWDRLGLDGNPRPIHLERGLANLQWDRTAAWVKQNLINVLAPVGRGDGWREERTGLHPLQFIETRRHWFTKQTHHHTNGTVNVLNLVEGDEAVVESPSDAFEPFTVHFAESFIVPAAVGPYTIRPLSPSGREHATLKAFCRHLPTAS